MLKFPHKKSSDMSIPQLYRQLQAQLSQRQYQRTLSRMTSGRNCRHLNRDGLDIGENKSRFRLFYLSIYHFCDTTYDISGAERLQRCIPKSQTIRLPKAGHLLLMENLESATADYLKFLVGLQKLVW
ncbi:MAG: alpha/beta fold hydrolase [Chroococcidiopsis sp.]